MTISRGAICVPGEICIHHVRTCNGPRIPLSRTPFRRPSGSLPAAWVG